MNLENYIQVSGPLFEAVQKSGLFIDPKTFLDSCPLSDPKDILLAYEKEKNQRYFDLKKFIYEHFIFPKEEIYRVDHTQSMLGYIDSMWEVLQKEMAAPSPYSTLISLPKPHLVPGGRFRECFYWDSYFTALGLVACGRIEWIKNMVENFASLIDRFGFIPNGNRIYFTSRSQPPYFSYLLKMLLDHVEERWVLNFMPQLEMEYQFWMQGAQELSLNETATRYLVRLDEKTFLNRYYDEYDFPRPEAYVREVGLANKGSSPEFFRHLRAACASGWDFSSRWLKNPKDFKTIKALDLLPVDLNCLMYHLELTLSDFAKRLQNSQKEREYQLAANRRKEAIQQIFWNEEKKFYFDYDFKKKLHTDVWSLAGVTPLFTQLATIDQAEAVSEHLKNQFLFEGGFTTSLYEGIHQWDHPNGWAPLQWITICALLNYGKDELAKKGATSWLKLNEKIFNETGKMLEKYNVQDCSSTVVRGEYTLQEGFGWTNGIALALKSLFHSSSSSSSSSSING